MEKILSLSFTFEDQDDYVRSHKGHAGNLVKSALNEADPRKIDNMGKELPDEVILKSTNFCSNWNDVIELIHKFEEIGVGQIATSFGSG